MNLAPTDKTPDDAVPLCAYLTQIWENIGKPWSRIEFLNLTRSTKLLNLDCIPTTLHDCQEAIFNPSNYNLILACEIEVEENRWNILGWFERLSGSRRLFCGVVDHQGKFKLRQSEELSQLNPIFSPTSDVTVYTDAENAGGGGHGRTDASGGPIFIHPALGIPVRLYAPKTQTAGSTVIVQPSQVAVWKFSSALKRSVWQPTGKPLV